MATPGNSFPYPINPKFMHWQKMPAEKFMLALRVNSATYGPIKIAERWNTFRCFTLFLRPIGILMISGAFIRYETEWFFDLPPGCSLLEMIVPFARSNLPVRTTAHFLCTMMFSYVKKISDFEN